MGQSLERNDKATQILKGAMQEFLHYGYAGTSMDRVAATAGVSKPTVYSHFHDKEGLFHALVKYVAQTRCQQVMGNETLQGPPAVVLRQVMTKAIDSEVQDLDYQNFVRLVAGESARFPHLAQAFIEHLTKPAIEELTTYLKTRPELHLADPEAMAHILLGSTAFYILSQRIMHGHTLLPLDAQRLVDSLVDLVTGSALATASRAMMSCDLPAGDRSG
ncbi:TetR family transcriptional regulator [Leptolyngbya sp. BL0902]|uniref:TetR/AcrR family transcriptional regulator n=1 Tax=Leptolyngbya sp. BL0902 TaxID=1115757 RepID=UPI001936B4BD|nr:TetR/AcrR family transcriptional regulator [Leptolyngbya sp. BL0902]QQE65205.1 TetR family transcriptional regulator [Leptolyngbya sp. BL0902]